MKANGNKFHSLSHYPDMEKYGSLSPEKHQQFSEKDQHLSQSLHLSALISPVRGRTGLLEKIGEGFRFDIRFFLKIRVANQKVLYDPMRRPVWGGWQTICFLLK